MKFIAICLHCLDMRDFHSNLRDTPFLDKLRSKSVFIPMGRAQGHHQGDSLNAEMTGIWTARFCDSAITEEGYTVLGNQQLQEDVKFISVGTINDQEKNLYAISGFQGAQACCL